MPTRFSLFPAARQSPLRLLSIALMGLVCALSLPAAASSFGYGQVVAKARSLAAQPYQAAPRVPAAYAKLDYHHWSSIHFKRSEALWPKSRFHVQLAPAGYLFKRAVKLHLVEAGKVKPLAFDASLFQVDHKLLPEGLPPQLGFAGFRLTYPINRADKQDEFLSFLGASYFRAVPQQGWFGLSARGVAIDTTASTPEQFPRFSSFWLVKPAPKADSLTVYALLNGKSLSGAYRFDISPGAPTVMDVHATLFLRHPVEQLGLAPLTSMFFYGAGNHKPANQTTSAIHDSDGLLMHRDDHWSWRPLNNPSRVTTRRFAANQLQGFGLFQRDRREADYQAPDAHYTQRPNLWIEPKGDWGPGHVSLVELPTNNSYMDNIVAFWTPKKQPAPGQPLRLHYQMSWRIKPLPSRPGRVVDTLIGRNASSGAVKYVIDYAGGKLSALSHDKPTGWVTTTPKAADVSSRVEPNPYTNGWRQVIEVTAHGKPLRIEAGLKDGHKALTERWIYHLVP